MASDYLEKYIESVTDLPAQLQRKFRLIRDLDEKSAKLQADVNDKCRKQLTAATAGAKSPGGSNKRPRLSPGAGANDPLVAEIQQGQAQLLSWAEEKMHIAFQVYDLVDKHIRELDEDLKSFASEVDMEAQSLGLGDDETACDRLGLEGGARVRGTAAAAAAAAAAGQGRQKRKTAGRRKGGEAALADAAAAAVAAAAAAAAAAGGGLQLDLAADASQPRYCVCQNISYGEMVACDNPECPIEWFHFACVGLTEQPKGKWYCPECAPHFQQKQHGHGHGHAHAGQQQQAPHKKTGKK